MREIKFRVWDGHKMNYEPCIWMGKEYMPVSDSFVEADIQQFTGFNDIDGKNIYDGDVVLAVDMYGSYKGKIDWWQDRWSLKYKGHIDGSEQTQSLMTVKNPKVIGNIYENPELLNASTKY